MKKRTVLSLIISLLMMLSVGISVQAEPGNPIEIYDLAGLEAIAKDPNGSYILMADIDMNTCDWQPIPFNGVFDGSGHTLYNLHISKTDMVTEVTIDGNHKEYDTYFAGLFSRSKGAIIKNLNILNADVNVNIDDNCFAAALVGFGEDTEISDCTVSGQISLTMRSRMCGVAGICGFGNGKFQNCDADVTLVLIDENTSVNCEEFLGAILSCGYGDIRDCDVKTRGYASVHGYVHNGGLMGMHHVHTKDKSYQGTMRDCTSDTTLDFFEHNTDRRAYGKAFIGENLHTSSTESHNTTVNFVKTEYKKYDKPLLPETCSAPEYKQEVISPTCTEFGYTLNTCALCGYSYRDDYTAPYHEYETQTVPATCTEPGHVTMTCKKCGAIATEELPATGHVPGEWEVAQEAGYQEEGLRTLNCQVCGAVLEQEAIPKKIAVSTCQLSTEEMTLDYQSTGKLSVQILPDDADNTNVIWTSSDPGVVYVDNDGNLYASHRGSAVITCCSEDGYAQSECVVTVQYNTVQWLKMIFLFGWLWY